MSITLIIIVLTVGISVYAWSNQELTQKWIFHPYSIITQHQYYRFVTSGFLHADWTHLLFNMFSFYMFAQVVERAFTQLFGTQNGIILFLLIYIGGIIVSDVYTFMKERKNRNYFALGASGGVSAIIFSSILLNPVTKIIIFPIPVGIPGFIFGLLYLVYSYFQAKRMGDNVNHDAHFYGAVFGFLLTMFIVPGALGSFLSQIQHFRIL